MLILIAESKTMLPSEVSVKPSELESHTPLLNPMANHIMEEYGGMPIDELIALTRLSPSLAAKLKKMAYEFSFKSTGLHAIEAFTGVVFKALDFTSLSPGAKDRANATIRIISSLYGFLRPDDIIKSYRLDFTSKILETSDQEVSLNVFWRKEVTKLLVNTVQKDLHTEILNLLPSDAAKCIDWKLVKRFAKVWKADFFEMLEGGQLKTPMANRLKTLRGLLLRQILEENITNIEGIKHLSSKNYFCEGTPQYPDHLRFLC